jgi:sec-independent protein translocase protein TatB
MFNIGPMELMVIAIVGLIVLGPDRLPGLAKDAARMLKTLREMANGARTQLRDELGPEFADLDLRNLNPRAAIQRAVLGDEDLTAINPKKFLQGAFSADDEPTGSAGAVSLDKVIDGALVQPPSARPAPQPLARGERAPFDADAT